MTETEFYDWFAPIFVPTGMHGTRNHLLLPRSRPSFRTDTVIHLVRIPYTLLSYQGLGRLLQFLFPLFNPSPSLKATSANTTNRIAPAVIDTKGVKVRATNQGDRQSITLLAASCNQQTTSNHVGKSGQVQHATIQDGETT